MNCPRCHNPLSDDAKYCSHCGLKISKCPHCQQPIKDDSRYCEYCGYALNQKEDYIGGYYEPLSMHIKEEQPHVYREVKEPSKKVNKWLVIGSVVALLLASGCAYSYINKGMPIAQKQEQLEAFKVNPIKDSIAHIGNMNQGGHVNVYKDLLYIVDDQGRLVTMNNELQNHRVIINDIVEYVNIVNDIIYYTNKDHNICKAQLDGTNQTVLLSLKAYYMNVIGDKIYYQNDTDSENIYVYDINTKKNTKLNNRRSYNINVVNDKIYYTSQDGIYSVGIDGLGDEKIIDGTIHQLIYREGVLYYTHNSSQVQKFDLKQKKIDTITDGVSQLVNMNKDYLFYNTREGLHKYSFNDETESLIDSHIYSICEILGDKLVIIKQNGQKTIRSIMDFNGKQSQRLFINQDGNFI